jgi:hypothetical protein
MLAVNDMFFLASPVVTSLFYEDVEAWLSELEIRYSPRVKFTGKSGYDHLFDFVIPKSTRQPERIARAINRPTKDAAESLAFAWIDTREVRPEHAKAIAFLNDTDRSVAPPVLDALVNYDIRPILWTLREEAREELAA